MTERLVHPTQIDSMAWVAFRCVAAAMLAAAPFISVPYGYFGMLRWIVTITAAWLVVRLWSRVTAWKWVFGTISVLFNPIAPIYLSRTAWTIIDIVSAALLLWSVRVNHGPITESRKADRSETVR